MIKVIPHSKNRAKPIWDFPDWYEHYLTSYSTPFVGSKNTMSQRISLAPYNQPHILMSVRCLQPYSSKCMQELNIVLPLSNIFWDVVLAIIAQSCAFNGTLLWGLHTSVFTWSYVWWSSDHKAWGCTCLLYVLPLCTSIINQYSQQL